MEQDVIAPAIPKRFLDTIDDPSEVFIAMVPAEFLADEFIMNGPLIARAARTSEGRYESADLFSACCENQMLLWVIVRLHKSGRRQTLGVVFTGINVYPRMKTLCLRYAAGVEVGSWASLLYTKMQEFARKEDCAMVETVCRPGWGRFLKKFDIKPKAIILEVRL